MINKALSMYEFANSNHPEKMKIFRFVISGGMATITNLAFLFILTDLFGVWYLLSAIISYIISFAVSFTMQKFWTFQDGSKEKIKSQATIYIIVTTLNLGLNTFCIYLFVEMGLHYLFAQILSSIIIAIESFFVYKYLFNTQSKSTSELFTDNSNI